MVGKASKSWLSKQELAEQHGRGPDDTVYDNERA
jgi:hypothetical protein